MKKNIKKLLAYILPPALFYFLFFVFEINPWSADQHDLILFMVIFILAIFAGWLFLLPIPNDRSKKDVVLSYIFIQMAAISFLWVVVFVLLLPLYLVI